MNGSSIALDTNTVLYLLNGHPALAELIFQKRIYLSFICELELLSYQGLSIKEKHQVEKFIGECSVIDINREIKEGVISIRKKYKLKLPDSIILATANYFEIPFLTFDKEFKKVQDKNVIILEL
jgi:predicted nucleic acid-binding protein